MRAEATAKELPRLGVADALELTILIARKASRRHPRVAARWLLRYLEEVDDATIDELVFAASCLAARTGIRYPDAAQRPRLTVSGRPARDVLRPPRAPWHAPRDDP
jgi:hypothetical protein